MFHRLKVRCTGLALQFSAFTSLVSFLSFVLPMILLQYMRTKLTDHQQKKTLRREGESETEWAYRKFCFKVIAGLLFLMVGVITITAVMVAILKGG
ncbi:MAG: hypothetical protein AAB567_02670 [Patescibacteria group bacterium]